MAPDVRSVPWLKVVGGIVVTVVALVLPFQNNPETIEGLAAIGLRPGVEFEATAVPGGLDLTVDGKTLFIATHTAEQLFVARAAA